MKLLIIHVLFLFTCLTSWAQQGELKGSVVDLNGNPLNNVHIGLKGTSISGLSNLKGDFHLRQVDVGNYVLVARYYDTLLAEVPVTIKYGEISEQRVQLKSSYQEIEEMEVSHLRVKESLPSPSLRVRGNLIELPQNIQIVDREIMETQQIYDMLQGIERNVSGAQRLEHWDNYARINMRGSQITPFRNGMNVHLSPWSPLTEDMSVVERVEFVKGPAGFMLGAGQPGGFYNVVTKKPSGSNHVGVNLGLGSFGFYRGAIDLDGVLTQNGKLQYRFNAMGQMKGSHRDFEFNNSYVFAPVLKYKISDKTALTLEYNEQFVQTNVIGSNYAFSKKGYADLPRNFTSAEDNLDPTEMLNRSVLGILEHNFNEKWKLTAQLGFLYDRQIGQSLWPWGISLYNDSLMQRGISIWDALGHNRNGQVFVNGRFTSGPVSHTLLAGIDMSQRDYWADWNQGATLGDSTFNIYDPTYGTVSASSIPQWDRSQDIKERAVKYSSGYTSVYVQNVFGFFKDKLNLTLAARFTQLRDVNPYSGTFESNKITPRAGLNWMILKNLAAYLVYDQAFLSNPGLDWEGNNFDPITGDNKEIGIKGDWFKGRLSTSVSAYMITKNNVLTTDLEHPDPITGQFIYSVQTGQQQARGVEIDIKGQILDGLSIVCNYAFTEARITKDNNSDFVGRSVAGATKHIQNTWLSYTLPTSALKGLSFNLGYVFQGGRSSWYAFDNTEQSLPDYFRLDGGIGYRFKHIKVDLLVNNLLDEYLYSGAPYGDMYYWQAEAGRNFKLNISYKF